MTFKSVIINFLIKNIFCPINSLLYRLIKYYPPNKYCSLPSKSISYLKLWRLIKKKIQFRKNSLDSCRDVTLI